MALVAKRGSRVVFSKGSEQAGWWKDNGPVYMDTVTGLPYVYHREAKFFMYLTPCCYAVATASDPEWGIYCKKCYENVPDLCGTGPDSEVVPSTPIRRVAA